MGFFAVFPVISEALKLVNNLNDPVKRREQYELLLDKKALKAKDAAEKLILALHSYQAGNVTEKQWKYLQKKYEKIFFDNN